MKLAINSICKKQLLPFSIFVLLSLFIWFDGPLLILAGHTPFAEPEKRMYVITALLLIWILKFIFLDVTPTKNKIVQPTFSPEITKKLALLQGKFYGALDFLKNTTLNKHGNKLSLAQLPWYLVIGATNSGKTALLANSKVNFILSKQFKTTDSLTNSKLCDWWVTREGVLIDIPGTYFFNAEKKSNAANILWHTFLNLLYKTSVPSLLHGVVVTLNFPELMKNSPANQKAFLVHHTKKYILDLRAKFGSQLPFYFVITKCDLIPGFGEFFSESSREEAEQPWGFTIPFPIKHKLVDVFTSRFNLLIKKINQQIILRLHQERNPNARPAIKDFPLHLEHLKKTATSFLKSLALPDLCLQGVYLTSAAQTSTEEPFNYTQSTTSAITHQDLQIMRAPPLASKAFFIKQLILQNFFYSFPLSETATSPTYYWQRRAMYGTSISIIVAAALWLGHDFQQGIQKVYSLQNDLTHYQMYIRQENFHTNHLVKALPLLDALQQAANNNMPQFHHLGYLLSFYSTRSQQSASMLYHQALQTIVLPEIKNHLERYLHDIDTKNPAFIYTALKAYLMLNDAEHRQPDFIANTLKQISAMNNDATHQVASHIEAAFTGNPPPISLDETLIKAVRNQLVNLPSNELSFLILKNMANNSMDSTIDLGTNSGNPPVFISKQIDNHIPNMFTVANFEKIISTEISLAATEALKGNWVLENILPSVNQPSLDNLVTQLNSQYIANYVDIWESQIANIQPYTPKNLLQVDEVIQNLTNNNSPLLQLLQSLQKNTAFNPINAASLKFQALNNLNLTGNIKESSLYQVFISLQQLHHYLQPILTAAHMQKAAFNVATNRIQNSTQDAITAIHLLAEQNPEPIKNWLNTIADQAWKYILQDAGKYIEDAWRLDVMSIYHQHLANHYPFLASSNEDANLQQFTDFMGHHGVLANFYLAYLKPFVNDKEEKWSWRIVDNQHLPFTNKLLINLQQAALIQQAFFPHDDNKLSLEFILQPVEIDPTLRGLTLNINGQQAVFQKHGKRLPRTFTWPGNYYLHETSVNFITPNKQLVSYTLKGDWGLFRLINNAAVGMNTHKGLLLNIAAQGYSAKYLLFTEERFNPFSATQLSNFELPQDLFESTV